MKVGGREIDISNLDKMLFPMPESPRAILSITTAALLQPCFPTSRTAR